MRVDETRHGHTTLEVNDLCLLSDVLIRAFLVTDVLDLSVAHGHGGYHAIGRAHGVDVAIDEYHISRFGDRLGSASNGDERADAESEKTTSHDES